MGKNAVAAYRDKIYDALGSGERLDASHAGLVDDFLPPLGKQLAFVNGKGRVLGALSYRI